MIRSKFKLLLIIPAFIFGFYSKSFGIVTVSADNPNFQYTGRIDFTVPDKPVMFWSGTHIRGNFEGTLLIISLDDETGQSYYDVFIDEDYANPHLIDCAAGSKIYLASATLTDEVHSFLLFRRTEASTGPTKFLGIQINDGKNLLPPPDRPEHKILFYGNSITCGMGNEAPDSYGDDNMLHENNFLTYGAVTSRMLNADYMCTAKSGIGIMISWFDLVMPEYYYRLDPDNAESHWDFNEFEPDVVVINLFQNDSWLLYQLVPQPTTDDIINAYTNFVREIRPHHTNAFIVCALGSMDATKTGSPWSGYIESAVEKLKTEDNDTNIGTCFFPFDPAWTKHPRVRHHQAMAEQLSSYISDKMGWITGVDENTTAVQPDSPILIQNYPNPFNPVTTIQYRVDKPGNIKIVIYDALGRKVESLVDEFKNSGTYSVVFNAVNLSSGIYYYQLRSDKNVATNAMLLIK